MMNNPAAAPKSSGGKMQKILNFIKRIFRRISHRWGWKLTSLVLAVFLWGGLISQDTSLPREKVISDVKITVTNEAVLRQNGLIVVSGLENLPPVKLKVSVPQKNYNSITAANYTVRLDLSQIKKAGEQKVAVTAAPISTSLYGTIVDSSLDEVTVVVEEYAARTRIPVQVQYSSQFPAGFYATDPVVEPGAVEISGPKSLVNQVARCIVDYDAANLAGRAGKVKTSLPFRLIDYHGNEVEARQISVTSQYVALRDIAVEQQVYALTSVPVDQTALISGQPAEGYQITEIKVIPESVLIAAEDLSPYLLEGAAIQPYNRLSVEGRTSSHNGIVSVRKPGTAAYINTYDLQVSVTIEPIADGAREADTGE